MNNDTIIELSELFKNIGLGLFVNGSYGLLQYQSTLDNSIVCLSSIIGMFISIKIQRIYK